MEFFDSGVKTIQNKLKEEGSLSLEATEESGPVSEVVKWDVPLKGLHSPQ